MLVRTDLPVRVLGFKARDQRAEERLLFYRTRLRSVPPRGPEEVPRREA